MKNTVYCTLYTEIYYNSHLNSYIQEGINTLMQILLYLEPKKIKISKT